MERVLVAYATRLGATRGIAEAIGAGLRKRGVDATVRSVTDDLDVGAFDAVVLGSGVFAGRWHKPAAEFARRHHAALARRPVWLFSSGPIGDATPAGPMPEPRDIADLRQRLRPRGHEIFWGAFDRGTVDEADLGRLFGAIARRFIPEGDWRDWPAIDAWAGSIARELGVREPAAVG